MKRLLALLLVLALFLPVLAFGESDIDLEEELVEDVDLDEDGDEFGSAEIKEEDLLSDELRKEMAATLESSDYTPKELDLGNLYINENLPTDKVINILLLGVDKEGDTIDEGDVKLADVQMILSYNLEDGSIKLTSILRDTLVTNPATGKSKPINESIQSYDANGVYKDSPQRAVATINYNFEMNIQYYIIINFHGVASIVDAVGGVDMDLTKGEAWNINAFIRKNGKKTKFKKYDTGLEHPKLAEKDGVQHLDGIQALIYARLRKSLSSKYQMGDDWQRTVRARHLVDVMLQKVLKMDFIDIVDLIGVGIEYVNSNMNVDVMFDLVRKVFASGLINRLGSTDSLIEQFRIPMGSNETHDKTWGYDPDSKKIYMSRNNGNFQKNVEGLHEFIYGRYYPANPE